MAQLTEETWNLFVYSSNDRILQATCLFLPCIFYFKNNYQNKTKMREYYYVCILQNIKQDGLKWPKRAQKQSILILIIKKINKKDYTYYTTRSFDATNEKILA